MLSAGLPNIYGQLNNTAWTVDNISTGCFYTLGASSSTSWNWVPNSSQSGEWNIAFNAGLSNAIYGSSDTVQPPAISTIYLIKH